MKDIKARRLHPSIFIMHNSSAFKYLLNNLVKAVVGLLMISSFPQEVKAQTTAAKQPVAKKIYINSNTGNDNNAGLSKASAWKTLKNLRVTSLLPGDSIFFAAGSIFKGGTQIRSSGNLLHPIVFTAYGKWKMPAFTNADYDSLNGNVFQVHGSHIVIKGLYFYNTANYTAEPLGNDKKKGHDKKILLIGAVYQVTEASHLVVTNCEFNDCPVAVYINGPHNLVTGNNFHDCNRFLWKLDWGPIALVIGNAFNEVSYNVCKNYVSTGGNYGADGGFIELDSRYYGGPVHDLYIHHNYSEANEGFMEVTNAGKNLNVSFNISDDLQQFIFFWSGDSSVIENNTVIRTRPANATVNVVFTFRNSGFQFRNNIFVVADSLMVFGSGAYDARNFDQLHEDNLYYSLDGTSKDPIGRPAGKGEIIGDPMFVDIKNKNYHLKKGSPAINKGAAAGPLIDFNGKLSEAVLVSFGAINDN